MILIKFKNLESSEIAREAVFERMGAILEKFPDLDKSKIQVTLEMENSPHQAGPDLFKVKVFIATGRYSKVTVEKSAANLYLALAHVVDHMLERLNRFGDKTRVKNQRNARKVIKKFRKEYGLAKTS